MRVIVATLLLCCLFVCNVSLAREACPVFKLGSYGSGTELWYAKFCDGPQFTTIVVPTGTTAAQCNTMSTQCVTGLPGVGVQGPRYHESQKGGYDDALLPHTTVVNHVASLIVTGTEEWFVSLGGNKFAKVVRVTYPSQTVTYPVTIDEKVEVVTEQISGFRAVYAFEINKGSLPDSRFIEAETLRRPNMALKLHRIAFEISDSEVIITEVLIKK